MDGRRERRLERETGFEPATSTLARSHSTTELFPLFGEKSAYHSDLCPIKTPGTARSMRDRFTLRHRCLGATSPDWQSTNRRSSPADQAASRPEWRASRPGGGIRDHDRRGSGLRPQAVAGSPTDRQNLLVDAGISLLTTKAVRRSRSTRRAVQICLRELRAGRRTATFVVRFARPAGPAPPLRARSDSDRTRSPIRIPRPSSASE